MSGDLASSDGWCAITVVAADSGCVVALMLANQYADAVHATLFFKPLALASSTTMLVAIPDYSSKKFTLP